ncbi:hypothetical protein [Thalassococcus sp. S3]|uniref:hypothetical protein n=1 Tax=Thalassococcus sp. S3 TaxID=2017482 RepID=UPI0010245958|nr:hypothetical protein [Thalassococcus sp. S3]QBF30178.1 hypothetical protein CFI11_02955 [Thalassococcus sp. S3]
MKKSSLVLTLALALSTSEALAQIAQTMADGQPWELTDPSGRSAELTLNPDGTGRVRLGFGRADTTWETTKDGMCLTIRPLGETCLELRQMDGGIVGTAQDGGTFIFRH